MLHRVGQFLVEVHVGKWYQQNTKYSDSKVSDFVGRVEAMDLRLFSHEFNIYSIEMGFGACCSEFSFIQRNWGQWERLNKTLFSMEGGSLPR